MTPTFIQRFVAGNGIWWIMPSVSAAYVAWVMVPATPPTVVGVTVTMVLTAMAGLLGMCLTLVPGFVVLGPLMHFIAERNGAPFAIGDDVVILARRHRGRVARVYELWPSRGQVKFDLGETEREAVTDVFSEVQVCRAPQATPGWPGDANSSPTLKDNPGSSGSSANIS